GFPGFPYTPTQLGLALNACFGLATPPGSRTPTQIANLALFLSATTIPLSFIGTDMGFATFAISQLIFDPAELDGQQRMGHGGVSYADAGIDAAIERVPAQPGGATRLEKNYTPTGAVGDIKIVSLHTDGDGLVLVENEKEYQDVVPAANLT